MRVTIKAEWKCWELNVIASCATNNKLRADMVSQLTSEDGDIHDYLANLYSDLLGREVSRQGGKLISYSALFRSSPNFRAMELTVDELDTIRSWRSENFDVVKINTFVARYSEIIRAFRISLLETWPTAMLSFDWIDVELSYLTQNHRERASNFKKTVILNKYKHACDQLGFDRNNMPMPTFTVTTEE